MATHEHLTPQVRASHHSLSGCRHGQPPVHGLVQRAGAAQQAGITEIGACLDDLGAWDRRALKRLVHEHHVRVAELEWVDLGEPRSVAEDDLLAMADIFGSRQLNVGVCSPDTYPESWLAKRLKSLAQRAADHNLTVAFEPVVFGSVPDIFAVQRIVEAACEPNVGMLLDVYHMARDRWDNLDGLYGELVVGVQINGIDRPAVLPSWPYGLLNEAQCDRLMPDEGDFPVGDWLAALTAKGVVARLSVEVLSDTHRALPLFDAAQRVWDTSHKFAAMWEGMQ